MTIQLNNLTPVPDDFLKPNEGLAIIPESGMMRDQAYQIYGEMKAEYKAIDLSNTTQEALNSKYDEVKKFREDNKRLLDDPFAFIPTLPPLPKKRTIEPNRCVIL
ncbi:MAG TPA: hypothetical protein VLE95_06635 [Chlamydiales bacterium]|nr:hypothetical protein [Chlamydiales bacterium]